MKASRVAHKLHRTLTKHLSGHIRAHATVPESQPVRVLIPDPSADGKPVTGAHSYVVDEVLPLFSGSCGEVALRGIGNAAEAGNVLLLTSPSGFPIKVDMRGTVTKPAIDRVASGEGAAELKRALSAARNRNRRNTETRILRVAGLHCSAVWLHHPADPERDTFIPYTRNFAGVRVGRSYSRARFEALLKKHATQAILRWYARYEKTATIEAPATQPVRAASAGTH